MAITVRTFFFQVLPVGVTFLMLTVSLVLLSITTSNPEQSSAISDWLVPLNISIFIILATLIIINVVKAFRHLHSGKAGSHFTLRLMYAFTLLTILPVLVVSYFSLNFIGDRIDNWFNIKIEGALDDSLELARSSLDVRMRQHLFDLERMSKALESIDELDYPAFIDRQLREMGAFEIVLLGNNKRVLVYSGNDAGELLPHFPTDDIFRKISSRGYMYQLEPAGKDGLFSRVAITLSPGAGRKTLILTALFTFSEKELLLAESVQNTYNDYKEISFNRERIKQSFRMTLLLIMLLSILFSVWAAFLYSLRLTKPIRELLEGTQSVASGNLQTKLTVAAKDDFSLLARSFNAMTARLSAARKESEQSQLQMQRQHDYLNIVLDNLTSGVITLDDDQVIRRVNTAAEHLFQAPLQQFKGQTLETLLTETPELFPLCDIILPYLDIEDAKESGNQEWQTEANLYFAGSKHTIVCRGAVLPESLDGTQGFVLVFDDISKVIQSEHDAAWSEVARRLAHEIKNPLTPIQLSAERLQHRIKPLLDEEQAAFLQRMSSTIINQVDTMKKMVNAFSEYARIPELHLKEININNLITEVAELYRTSQPDVQIRLNLKDTPAITADADRMRQLLINLIKNALEAMQEKKTDSESLLLISSKVEQHDNKRNYFVLTVCDNGIGIDEELLPHLFEPYKTTKIKGTGLGLAIVKRIVEEHDGWVTAKNNMDNGATISIYLPVVKRVV